MKTHSRARCRRLLSEAEGYLELITAVSEKWPLQTDVRDRIAQRALQTLSGIEPNGSAQQSAVSQLQGEALRAMERYEEAIEPLSRASKYDSQNPYIHLALGWCFKRVGKLDLAIQALEDALEAHRDMAIIYYNLACYWSLANNVGLALAHLSQAIELDASYRELVADEPDFNPMRDHPEFVALTTVIV